MADGRSSTEESDGRSAPTGNKGSHNPLLVLTALFGSILSTLCCIGIAPLVSLVVALGLGFILTLAILLPALVVFLLIGGYGLWLSYRRHGNPYPLILHTSGGVAVSVLIYFVLHTGPWIWIGFAGFIAAAIWNVRLEYAYWHRVPEVDFSRAG